MRKFPEPMMPSEYPLMLAQMVAQTSWLPHPNTVKAFEGAVFPTVRSRKGFPRCSHIVDNGRTVGMFDDNATPSWALLWSHDIRGRKKGWTVAHIWAETDCIHSFTHIANLALIPECFGTLTDKTGPLTDFLRWHSWIIYQWKPSKQPEPMKPAGYDSITWRYFENVADPKASVFKRLKQLKSKRVQSLLPIIQGNLE